MDLWIRSQDKTKLVKSSYLTLFLSDTNWVIYSDTTTGEPFDVGKYKTKERALEVLDEIHNMLKPKGILKFNAMIHDKDLAKIKKDLNDECLVFGQNVELIQQPETYVYEMPLE